MLLWGIALAAQAASVSVYRCVDARGRVALQDRPCPPGQLDRQQSVRLAPPAAPARVTPPPPAPASSPERLPDQPTVAPPPALWVCVDYEGERRYASGNDPRPRYVPLWVVSGSGFDLTGRPTRTQIDAGTGRVQYSVLIEDQCRRLSDSEACRAYRDQRDDARRVAYNRIGDEKRSAEAEAERLADLLSAHCGG